MSSSGVQYCDGVRGALIIKDPHDPLQLFYDGVYPRLTTGLEVADVILRATS